MNKSMAHQEDQSLIRRILDGETEAFGDLVRKYQDRLFHGMVHLLRNESEAEDVVQDTFVLAFTKLDSFQGKSAFFTWLYRIGYNTAISKIRKRKPTQSLEGGIDEHRMELPGHGSAPSDRMERQEQAEQLMQAMGKLSDSHRAILILREIEGLDYDAISEILDLPIGTVRSRLHRARQHLREQLELIMDDHAI